MIRYTEKKLAEEIGKAVREIDPGLRATYRRDRGSVAIAPAEDPEQPPATLFLGNMFLNVRDLSRDERADVILGTLRDLLAEDPPSPEVLMASLTLRVQTPIGRRAADDLRCRQGPAGRGRGRRRRRLPDRGGQAGQGDGLRAVAAGR